jgi:hypothetical protein
MAKANQSQPVETKDPDKTGNGKMARKTGGEEMNRWTTEPGKP